jgi:hypothetical protein
MLNMISMEQLILRGYVLAFQGFHQLFIHLLSIFEKAMACNMLLQKA